MNPQATPLGRKATLGLQAALALLVLTWLFRGLLDGRVLLQADLIQLFEPLRQVFAEEIRRGNFAWASALGNGRALLGNPLHGVAYPPNWLCVVVEPARALSMLCAIHVGWGALGAWSLARERGARAVGAWTAGAAFALCGVSLSAALMPNLGWPLAWLPWLVLAHARIRRRPASWPGSAGGPAESRSGGLRRQRRWFWQSRWSCGWCGATTCRPQPCSRHRHCSLRPR